MAGFDLLCHECGAVVHVEDFLTFRAECEACCADLHVCLACRFYDKYVADECRIDEAEYVSTKDRRNLCEELKPLLRGNAAPSEADAAKAKLAALFGGSPGATEGDAGRGQPEAISAADAAKAKLEALFKKL